MQRHTFDGKAVIVTGASSGIGRAVALQLAAEGARLALAARSAERLEAVVQDCRQRGCQAIAVPTDVSDEAQCRALVERARDEYGRLDMLVNNAGMAMVAKLDELADLDLFRQVMEVNFYGAVYCTYHALPHLKETRGQIVNIASLGGRLAIPFNTSYVDSKFALVGLSDSLRMELARAGVSVTVVCPYWVVTEFHERLMDKEGRPRGAAGRALYTEKMMTADQCAQIVLEAARRRKREVIMRPGPLVIWLKQLAPGLADKLIIEAFLRPAVRRASAEGREGAA